MKKVLHTENSFLGFWGWGWVLLKLRIIVTKSLLSAISVTHPPQKFKTKLSVDKKPSSGNEKYLFQNHIDV